MTTRAWYEKNKEHDAARHRSWYQRNKERKAATVAAWRAKNKDRILAAAAVWAQTNKVRRAISQQARRAREINAPGQFSEADVRQLWDQQFGVCAAPHCNTPLLVSCTVDHKLPLSRGGSNWPSNLQLLCGSCNSRKKTKTMDEWLCIGEAA